MRFEEGIDDVCDREERDGLEEKGEDWEKLEIGFGGKKGKPEFLTRLQEWEKGEGSYKEDFSWER